MREYDGVTVQYQVTQGRYLLKDSLPDGRLVWIDEEPGRADVHILRGAATAAFCDHMTREHEYILGGGGSAWSQYWTPGELRADGPAQHLGFARAWWEIDDSRNSVGELAVPLERDGAFVWVIRAGHVKPRALAEMNAFLLRLVGDGLWRQDWDDSAVVPGAPVVGRQSTTTR